MTPTRPLAVLAAAAATTALVTAVPTAQAQQSGDPHWVVIPTGSTQQFRGLDAVDRDTAWVGGSDGQVLRTTDGGDSWQVVSPEGTTGLLFRDVEAHSALRASVMAIGEGDDNSWCISFFSLWSILRYRAVILSVGHVDGG
jgi:hypothetical protein